jgi:uncharacterized protein
VKTKTYTADVKAADDAAEGTFEALVSIFGNVDYAGDRVIKGAFADSLTEWKTSGDPIPVVFSHRWDDLDAHIGKVIDAEERDEGLWVKAQLDLDDPAGAKVHRLLTDRRLKQFSFAYDVVDERKGDDGANELLKLKVHEVGPTLLGMNPDTVLLGAKAGRVLSGKNETKLRQAADLLTEVLSAVDTTSDDEEAKSHANPDDPKGKGDEPTTRSPSDVRLLAELEALDS